MKALGPLAGRASPLSFEARAASQLAVADRDILARTPAPRRTREN